MGAYFLGVVFREGGGNFFLGLFSGGTFFLWGIFPDTYENMSKTKASKYLVNDEIQLLDISIMSCVLI